MRKLIALLICQIFCLNGFGQQPPIAFPEGSKLVFAVRENTNVRWHYQEYPGSEWEVVSTKAIHVQTKSRGKLVVVAYRDELKYSVLDTIEFKEPLMNQGEPLIVNGRIYNSVRIGDFDWMTEDFDGGPYSYEEALEIANSIPGWGLPSRGWGAASDTVETIVQLLNELQIRYGRCAGQSLGVMKGQSLGLDLYPNAPEVDPAYLSNRDFQDTTASYFWTDGYNGAYAMAISDSCLFLRGIQALQYSKTKVGLRLVKEPENYNHPPSLPRLVWPYKDQVNIATNSNFTWGSATDPDGDLVIYDLHVSKTFTNNARPQYEDVLKESLFETDGTFYHDLEKNEEHKWYVIARDYRGARRYFEGYWSPRTFRTYKDGTSPVSNPGTYGVGNIALLSPANGSYFKSKYVNLKFSSFSSNETYKVYLGQNNPPKMVRGNHRFTDGGTNTFSFEDQLEAGKTYYWMVEAYNDQHELVAQSNTWSFEVGEPPIMTVEYVEEIATEDEIEVATTIVQETKELPVDPQIQLVFPPNGALISRHVNRIQFDYTSNIDNTGGPNRLGNFVIYGRILSKANPFNEKWNYNLNTFNAKYMITQADIENGCEVEWKVIFIEDNTRKEVAQSETWKFKLTDKKLAVPNVRIVGKDVVWDPVPHAQRYFVQFHTKQLRCFQCYEGFECSDIKYKIKVDTTSTRVAIPPCDSVTLSHEVSVIAYDPTYEYGPSDPSFLVMAADCGEKQCPENLISKMPGLPTPKVKVSSGGSGGSGSSGGSGGSSGPTNADLGLTADGFLDAGSLYAVTWQTERGNWMAAGPTQKITLSEPTEEEAWGLAVNLDRCTSRILIKRCGIYNIYYLSDCKPQGGDYNVINFLHTRGCY